jgi:hypothetical protein
MVLVVLVGRDILIEDSTGVTLSHLWSSVARYEQINNSHRTTTELDVQYKEFVWGLLSSHPDFDIRDTNDTNNGSNADAAAERREYTLEDAENNPQIRVGTTSERQWHALTGHGVDWNRIPRLEFILLGLIALSGPQGILQPELVKQSGQDIRSVPKRTDALTKKGYIQKTAAAARGVRTSRLTLRKFVVRKDLAEKSLDDEAKFGGQHFDIEEFVDRIMDLVRKHQFVVTADLRLTMGITSRKQFQWRNFNWYILALENCGFLTRCRAFATFEGESDTFRKCVKYRQELTEHGRRTVLQGYGQLKLYEFQEEEDGTTKSGDAEKAGADEAADDEEDLNNAVDLEKNGTSNSRKLQEVQRVVPQWIPGKEFTTEMSNFIGSLGSQGRSALDIRQLFVGEFYKRVSDIALTLLCNSWQASLPNPLRHLALIRDFDQSRRNPHYRYYTYTDFKTLVDQGVAEWAGHLIKPRKEARGQALEMRLDTGAVGDGFIPIDAKRLVKKGPRSMVHCASVHGDETFGQMNTTLRLHKKLNGKFSIIWSHTSTAPQGSEQNQAMPEVVDLTTADDVTALTPAHPLLPVAAEEESLSRTPNVHKTPRRKTPGTGSGRPRKYAPGKEPYNPKWRNKLNALGINIVYLHSRNRQKGKSKPANLQNEGAAEALAKASPKDASRLRRTTKQAQEVVSDGRLRPYSGPGAYVRERKRDGEKSNHATVESSTSEAPTTRKMFTIHSERLQDVNFWTDLISPAVSEAEDGAGVDTAPGRNSHLLPVPHIATPTPAARSRKRALVAAHNADETESTAWSPSPKRPRHGSEDDHGATDTGATSPSGPDVQMIESVDLTSDMPQDKGLPSGEAHATVGEPAPDLSSTNEARIIAGTPAIIERLIPQAKANQASLSGAVPTLESPAVVFRPDTSTNNEIAGPDAMDVDVSINNGQAPADDGSVPILLEKNIPDVERYKDRRRSHLDVRPTLAGSMLGLRRRKVFMKLLHSCGGVCPSDREAKQAFRALWKLENPDFGTADWRTVQNIASALVAARQIKQVGFAFKSTRGIMVTRSMFLEYDLSPTDPKVKAMEQRIIAADGEFFWPEEAHVPGIDQERDRTKATNPKTHKVDTVPTEESVKLLYKPAGWMKRSMERNSRVRPARSDTPVLSREERKAQSAKLRELVRKQTTTIETTARRARQVLGQRSSQKTIQEYSERNPARAKPSSTLSLLPKLVPLLDTARRSALKAVDQSSGSFTYASEEYYNVFEQEAGQVSVDFTTLHVFATKNGYLYDQIMSPTQNISQSNHTFGTYFGDGLSTKFARMLTGIARTIDQGSVGLGVNYMISSVWNEKVVSLAVNILNKGYSSSRASLLSSRLLPASNGGFFNHTAAVYGAPSQLTTDLDWIDERGEARRLATKRPAARLALSDLSDDESSDDEAAQSSADDEPEESENPEAQGSRLNKEHGKTQKVTYDRKGRNDKQQSTFETTGICTRELTSIPLSALRILELPIGKTRHRHNDFNTEKTRKLFMLIIAVRVLLGGSKSNIDWGIVTRVWPDSPLVRLRQVWNQIRKARAGAMLEAHAGFQKAFLNDYESGVLPQINLDNPQEYDWEGLVEWGLKRVFLGEDDTAPILPATKQEFEEIYELNDIRGSLEEPNRPLLASSVKKEIFSVALFNEDDRPAKVKKAELKDLLCKSVIRANTLTPESRYDPRFAQKVLYSLMVDSQIDEKCNEMMRDKILVARKGILAERRKVDVTDVFNQVFKSLPISKETVLEALAYRFQLEEEFVSEELLGDIGEETEADGSFGVNVQQDVKDGHALAILDLVGTRKVDLVPTDLPDDVYGWVGDGEGYKSRNVPRDQIIFPLRIRRREEYVFSPASSSRGEQGGAKSRGILAIAAPNADQTVELSKAMFSLPIRTVTSASSSHPQASNTVHPALVKSNPIFPIPLWIPLCPAPQTPIQDSIWVPLLLSLLARIAAAPGIRATELAKQMKPAVFGSWEIVMALQWAKTKGVVQTMVAPSFATGAVWERPKSRESLGMDNEAQKREGETGWRVAPGWWAGVYGL